MVARRLNVAKPPLEACGAIESCALCEFHRQIHGRYSVTGNQLPANHDLIDRACRRCVCTGRGQHPLAGETGGRELCFHSTGKLDGMVARLSLPGERDCNISRTLGHAEIHRIDEREGDGGDGVEAPGPAIYYPMVRQLAVAKTLVFWTAPVSWL
jgi:hypothetical protein